MSWGWVFGGFVLSWIVFGIIVFNCFAKRIDNMKISFIIITVLAIVAAGALGYLGRTELVTGDYAHEDCAYEGCKKDPVSKFQYAFGTNYYCDRHIEYCYRIVESWGKSEKDQYGMDSLEAWFAGTSTVENELGAKSNLKFCRMREGSSKMNPSKDGWVVSGYVEYENANGTMERHNFRVGIRFTSSSQYSVNYCEIY